MALPPNLRWFKRREFKHPELVDEEAAYFLDAVRAEYGASLVLTSDARTVAENASIPGHSTTSLHLQGRAFDLRWTFTKESLDRLVNAIYRVRDDMDVATEIELVRGPTDQHVHIGVWPDSLHPSTLVLALD